jgi:hypothetical protein
MRKATTTVQVTPTLQSMKMDGKAKPFAAQFATRLESVNSKLVCALSAVRTSCVDDHVA